MADMGNKSFGQPDETRTFSHGKVELIQIGEGSVGRFSLEPGWRWSNDVKPLVKTEWCENYHHGYHLSGTMHVRMASGEEFDIKPGEVGSIPPGHDAWVVGNEPVVTIDWAGATNYAKEQKRAA